MLTIFLGSPGTGKGTISKELEEKNNFKHISTGDIFRKIIKSESELGNKIKEIMESGNLINDDMTNEVLVEGLKDYDLINDKIILDGYPRTINQAKFLDKYIEENNLELKKVILLTLPEEEQLKRLTGRRICSSCGASYHIEYLKPEVEGICDKCNGKLIQREDDKIENVKVRLETYDKLTKPLIEYYDQKNMISTIDASEDYKDNATEIIQVLNGNNQ